MRTPPRMVTVSTHVTIRTTVSYMVVFSLRLLTGYTSRCGLAGQDGLEDFVPITLDARVRLMLDSPAIHSLDGSHHA